MSLIVIGCKIMHIAGKKLEIARLNYNFQGVVPKVSKKEYVYVRLLFRGPK